MIYVKKLREIQKILDVENWIGMLPSLSTALSTQNLGIQGYYPNPNQKLGFDFRFRF